METLLIAVILITSLAVFFYFRISKRKSPSAPDAPILLKYAHFVQRIREHNKLLKAEVIKANSMVIRTAPAKSAPVYTLTEVSARTIIVWTWSDPNFGPRGKEWSFPDTYDQDKMYQEVIEDVFNYQTEIYQKHNQRMPAQVI